MTSGTRARNLRSLCVPCATTAWTASRFLRFVSRLLTLPLPAWRSMARRAARMTTTTENAYHVPVLVDGVIGGVSIAHGNPDRVRTRTSSAGRREIRRAA